MATTHVVTGAFSYTGSYITQRLLAQGHPVRTLTGHPDRPNLFGSQVVAVPYNFDKPEALAASLQGAEVLFNTYWVRYPYGNLTYEKAIENSRTLFQCAKKAGVKRVVHVSIANPSQASPLAYYSGKWRVEDALKETGLSYAIFRPTVIFSKEDILINNIAWMVRHFPIFGAPGNGKYGIQPIYVEDIADAMVRAAEGTTNTIQDAVGPEQFIFEELVKLIADKLGKRVRVVHTSPAVTYVITSVLGRIVGDIILTREEIQGLMDNLLVSANAPLGTTRLSEWLDENRATVGTAYASEVKRHF
jgi:NADH dehydrogenase